MGEAKRKYEVFMEVADLRLRIPRFAREHRFVTGRNKDEAETTARTLVRCDGRRVLLVDGIRDHGRVDGLDDAREAS